MSVKTEIVVYRASYRKMFLMIFPAREFFNSHRPMHSSSKVFEPILDIRPEKRAWVCRNAIGQNSLERVAAFPTSDSENLLRACQPQVMNDKGRYHSCEA